MENAVKASPIFNGTYTVRNRETGEYRTFSIRTQADDAKFAPGQRVITLLSGPDNTADYQAFGFVTDSGVRVFRSKRGGAFDAYAKLVWLLAVHGDETPMAKRYELMLEGRCIKCNRKLTDPVSIETGIGPVCAGR